MKDSLRRKYAPLQKAAKQRRLADAVVSHDGHTLPRFYGQADIFGEHAFFDGEALSSQGHDSPLTGVHGFERHVSAQAPVDTDALRDRRGAFRSRTRGAGPLCVPRGRLFDPGPRPRTSSVVVAAGLHSRPRADPLGGRRRVATLGGMNELRTPSRGARLLGALKLGFVGL